MFSLFRKLRKCEVQISLLTSRLDSLLTRVRSVENSISRDEPPRTYLIGSVNGLTKENTELKERVDALQMKLDAANAKLRTVGKIFNAPEDFRAADFVAEYEKQKREWYEELCAATVRIKALESRSESKEGMFITAVLRELVRARRKFPISDRTLAAVMEEVGELAKSKLENEAPEWVYAEAVQVAVMAIRVALEGDRSIETVAIPAVTREGRAE